MSDEITPPKPIYVYVLTDPRYPNDVRYVGVTDNPKRRLQDHLRSSPKKANNHRTCWIKSVLDSGFVPIMTEIDQTDNENWQECEIGWIAYYRGLGCDLVNSADGGRGTRGYIPNEETRRKRGESNRGKKRTEATRKRMSESQIGKTHTIETRQKLSEIQLGRKLSDEHRHKISEGGLGRIQPESVRRKVSEAQSIAVLQYDKFGNSIRQWDSMTLVEKETGINQGHISDCCRYKRKTAGGFMWRYADDPLLGEQPTQLRIDFEE